MNWRRLELLVTTSFGLATLIALALVSINAWAPKSWLLRQLASDPVVDFLARLGGVSSGLLAIIFIAVFGGSLIMTLLLRGYEKLAEIRAERRRIREEERAAGHAEGRAEGLAVGIAEGRAEGLSQGRTEGLAEGRAVGQAERDERWQVWVNRLIEEGKLSPNVGLPPEEGNSNREELSD